MQIRKHGSLSPPFPSLPRLCSGRIVICSSATVCSKSSPRNRSRRFQASGHTHGREERRRKGSAKVKWTAPSALSHTDGSIGVDSLLIHYETKRNYFTRAQLSRGGRSYSKSTTLCRGLVRLSGWWKRICCEAPRVISVALLEAREIPPQKRER